jgi:hypothetical protein
LKELLMIFAARWTLLGGWTVIAANENDEEREAWTVIGETQAARILAERLWTRMADGSGE